MYVGLAVREDNWSRIVADFAARRPKLRLGGLRIRPTRGLGDTCWIAPTGQRVCGAGDPAAQVSQQVCISPSTPQNAPRTSIYPKDPITASGGVMVWTPGSGNKRTFQFRYHAGTTDVYQKISGGSCAGGVPVCEWATVDPSGYVTWLASPPAQSEPPCTVTDPLQQTGAVPGSASQCYINPSNGQLVCGAQTQVYPAVTSTAATYPASSGGGSPYVSTGEVSAAPASSGGLMNDLTNLPTWAKVGGGAALAFLGLKFFKKGR